MKQLFTWAMLFCYAVVLTGCTAEETAPTPKPNAEATDPATTEPEATDPETTEPETTDPETTEPETGSETE